jgi:hypothetical protein
LPRELWPAIRSCKILICISCPLPSGLFAAVGLSTHESIQCCCPCELAPLTSPLLFSSPSMMQCVSMYKVRVARPMAGRQWGSSGWRHRLQAQRWGSSEVASGGGRPQWPEDGVRGTRSATAAKRWGTATRPTGHSGKQPGEGRRDVAGHSDQGPHCLGAATQESNAWDCFIARSRSVPRGLPSIARAIVSILHSFTLTLLFYHSLLCQFIIFPFQLFYFI